MSYKFTHVGIGTPEIRSHMIFKASKITSTCAKKAIHYHSWVSRFTSDVADVQVVSAKHFYVLPMIVHRFIYDTIHVYSYSNREFYVFPIKYYELFDLAIGIRSWIIANDRYSLSNVIRKMFSDALEKSRTFDEMLSNFKRINREIIDVDAKIARKIDASRKAFKTRIEKRTKKAMQIINKYFPDLLKPIIHVINDSYDATLFLSKFYNDRNIVERYSRFITAHDIALIIPHDIIMIVTRYAYDHDIYNKFRIFVDGCTENEKFVVCKIIGADTYDGKDYKRARWVAIIGYDKLSNQRFLHYVPPFMILKSVETCRKWVLGLVDDFGRPLFDGYELIEI